MKFNKNFIILVIATIVLYLIIMALLFFRNNSDNWNEARTDYLMVGYNELWRIRGEEVTTVDQKDRAEVFGKRVFDIYQNTNYIGHYSLIPLDNGMFQYRNDGRVLVDIYPTLIAYSSINNTEFKVVENVDSRPVTSDEFTRLEQYIPEEAKTPYIFNELMTNYKLTYDFDKDGMNEIVYSIGSLFNDEYSDSEYVFQLVLYEDDNGTIQEVVKESVLRSEQYLDAYQYEFLAVLQFSNSEKYSIVFNGYRPMGGLNDCPILMSFDGFNSLRTVKSCQEVENS